MHIRKKLHFQYKYISEIIFYFYLQTLLLNVCMYVCRKEDDHRFIIQFTCAHNLYRIQPILADLWTCGPVYLCYNLQAICNKFTFLSKKKQ